MEYQQASQITLVSDVLAFAHAIQNLVESRCSNSALCDAILEDQLLGEESMGNVCGSSFTPSPFKSLLQT